MHPSGGRGKFLCRRWGDSIGMSTKKPDSYLLGVLWACCSIGTDDLWWVRHRDPKYPQYVHDVLGVGSLHTSYSRTGAQTRLKISAAADRVRLEELLEWHGWTPRNSGCRALPKNCPNLHGFVRAWVEIHGVEDIAKNRGKQIPRLRIYGAYDLVVGVSDYLAEVARGPRKPQKTVGEHTWGIYYQGRSVRSVVEFLEEP